MTNNNKENETIDSLENNSKKGLIKWCIGGASLIIAIIFMIIFINAQVTKAKERKMKARRAIEAKARLVELKRVQKIEDEKRRWQALVAQGTREKLKTENDFIRLFTAIKDFYGGDPDDKEALQAKLEKFKKSDIEALMLKLDSQANELISQNKFLDAAAIYQDYSDDFKEDSEKFREEKANICFNKDDELKAKKKKEKEELEAKCDTLLNTLSAALISKKRSTAISIFNNSPLKKELPKVTTIINNLSNINKIFLNSFDKDIGKEITIRLKNRKKAKVVIKEIKKKRVYVETKKANLVMIKKYSISDFALSEVSKRISAFDKESGALYSGIKAVKSKQFDKAEDYFQECTPLAAPLIAQLMIYIENKDSGKEEAEEVVKEEIIPDVKNWRRLKRSIKVIKGSKKRIDLGLFEETIKSKLKFSNKMGHSIKCSANLLLIGESLLHKKSFKVIADLKENLSLSSNQLIEKTYSSKNSFNEGTEEDDGMKKRQTPKSGYKYYSWLFIVKDDKGKNVIVESKHNKFKTDVNKILKADGKNF